ncbi:MAG: hypothetical protein JXA44_04060 [Methanospirillaceae archaeon]|nr:hypothetical protein [Methanospirillaceae archaeon]
MSDFVKVGHVERVSIGTVSTHRTGGGDMSDFVKVGHVERVSIGTVSIVFESGEKYFISIEDANDAAKTGLSSPLYQEGPGTCILSRSGKSLNFWTDPITWYTCPLSQLNPVLSGEVPQSTKAPLFCSQRTIQQTPPKPSPAPVVNYDLPKDQVTLGGF